MKPDFFYSWIKKLHLMMDEVEQNIVICLWQADQLFLDHWICFARYIP